MRKGYPSGYSVKTFYKDQKKLLGGKAIQNHKLCADIVGDFFHILNRTIIRDNYEFKIPSRGGYLRISKNKKGIFHWLWDKTGDYCHLTRKPFWSFEPVVGWRKPVEIGHRGLMKWIIECKLDPFKPKYSVVRKFKRIKIH
jgi:hypothetical protein